MGRAGKSGGKVLVIRISLRVSIAVLKYCGQNQLGEERVCLAYTSWSWPITEVGAEAEAVERWCWLAPHALLNLLSSSTQDPIPGPVPPTVSWALSRGSLFSVSSSLCQVDKPTTKTPPSPSRKPGHCAGTRTRLGLQHPRKSRIQWWAKPCAGRRRGRMSSRSSLISQISELQDQWEILSQKNRVEIDRGRHPILISDLHTRVNTSELTIHN